ncbi:hypothetical protein LDL08_36615 [Nonomuraea glycinis]|uniref:Uncharacterized protein n=1 Tax=Nonomuraea glycinis TaxID=2047744 RepID=A0A918E9D7_9ACTN|nr:hypothetical protein [Nonomuraea glycinis]MCA2181700.1 hypothetical protein [Nonomuraea glycinis]GGP14894.1 hypothetical protein GCM10012278_72470 [Nonomuraea glycinis]
MRCRATLSPKGRSRACPARPYASWSVALRSTYPGWEIQHVIGGPEIDKWTAELRRETTGRLLAAGVKERVEAPDATALASALSHQITLLHNARAYMWPD